MAKKPAPPAPYPDEFRARLIELVRAGQTPEELSRKFEPTAQTIRNWVRQADLDSGQRTDGLTNEERPECRGRQQAHIDCELAEEFGAALLAGEDFVDG